jgi:hypothetical protein
MDDKTSKIIAGYLKKWQGQVITKEMLGKLRDDIHKKTRKNKFAPFSNVKKWIKAVRKQMKAEKKAKEAKSAPKAKAKGKKGREKAAPSSKSLPARVEESIQALKDEVHMPAPPVEIELPKAPIVFDKVYLQNIQFEISSIRQLMERVSRQLDKLEKELSSHRPED